MLYSPDSHQHPEAAQELIEHLRFIEQEGLQKCQNRAPTGLGAEISLVDLTYYPMFEQWAVLEHYRGVQLPPGLDRLKQWWETMATRESVRAIAHSPEFYIERYGQFDRAIKAQTMSLK